MSIFFIFPGKYVNFSSCLENDDDLTTKRSRTSERKVRNKLHLYTDNPKNLIETTRFNRVSRPQILRLISEINLDYSFVKRHGKYSRAHENGCLSIFMQVIMSL